MNIKFYWERFMRRFEKIFNPKAPLVLSAEIPNDDGNIYQFQLTLVGIKKKEETNG